MLQTTRAARLNPRRYAEIVRLLKDTIKNEKAGLARRMRAAELLLGLYERHDRAQERKQVKNAPAGDATPEPGKQDETAPVGETREEKNAREVEESLAYLRSGGAALNADRP
jgi:hypothetical protein